ALSGQPKWARAITTNQALVFRPQLGVSAKGRLAVAAQTLNTPDLGQGPLRNPGTGQAYGSLVGAYDSADGRIQWSRAIFGTGTQEEAQSVTFDTGGNVIVGGEFGGATVVVRPGATGAEQAPAALKGRLYFFRPSGAFQQALSFVGDNFASI